VTAAARLSLPARAKLNLWLAVTGRRADGYHLLDTLFHTLELHDDVEVALAPAGITLTVTADEPRWAVPAGPDNLVERALARIAARAGYRGGFAARLHKRIPHGAGLGGGSSDAAAALRLANALLGAPLAADALTAEALALGADVPFFLAGGSQRASGIGERLSPWPVPPQHWVLVVPPFGCPTAGVYESFAAQWKRHAIGDTVHGVPFPDSPDSLFRMGFHNALQPAAERVRPELAALRHDVAALGRREVGMTGSGSTLFVRCERADDARACAVALAPLHARGVRVLVTRSAGADVDAPRPPDEARGGSGERG
jgi:4-diphosphocytidyl-2-C-methyl-D-erythritol kinase